MSQSGASGGALPFEMPSDFSPFALLTSHSKTEVADPPVVRIKFLDGPRKGKTSAPTTPRESGPSTPRKDAPSTLDLPAGARADCGGRGGGGGDGIGGEGHAAPFSSFPDPRPRIGAASASSTGRAVWICSSPELGGKTAEEACWRLAHVVAGGGDERTIEVVCEGDDPVTGRQTVAVSAVYAVDRDDLCRCDDLSQLHHLNEPNVLRGLSLRFGANQIYTFAGPILIAINPWQSLDIYSEQHAQRHTVCPPATRGREPHVFAIAAEAFRCLAAGRHSQSILVSGESGSGKTETCKYVMQHLAVLSSESATTRGGDGVNGSQESDRWSRQVCGGRRGGEGERLWERQGRQGIERQVLESNPILEAFGNARTARNDNSSRFGKFIQLRFQPCALPRPQGGGEGMGGWGGVGGGLPLQRNAGGLQLRGGAILTYLLERTRVVSLSAQERNYHFLYQLCAAANSGSVALPSASPALNAASVEKLSDPAVRASLGLGGGGAAKFRITAMGDCLELDGVDDAAGYRRTVHAMSLIGIDVGEQLDMLRVISAVLHLGNISFEAKESLFSPRKEGRSGVKGGGGGPRDAQRTLVGKIWQQLMRMRMR